MRRADRLFRLIELLRRSDLMTARQLADELEVSERTVYRDIKDLSSSGVPIEGEPGVGYMLESFDLPPLMFDHDEIEALVFGMRMVGTWGDTELAAAARRALAKVEVALPSERQHLVEGTPLFVAAGGELPDVDFDVGLLRRAVRDRHRVRIEYEDAHGARTERTLRPLGMAFFGQTWLLIAWCELRDDFRAFRPDRIQSPRVLPEAFPEERGKQLSDFLERVRAEGEAG